MLQEEKSFSALCSASDEKGKKSSSLLLLLLVLLLFVVVVPRFEWCWRATHNNVVLFKSTQNRNDEQRKSRANASALVTVENEKNRKIPIALEAA